MRKKLLAVILSLLIPLAGSAAGITPVSAAEQTHSLPCGDIHSSVKKFAKKSRVDKRVYSSETVKSDPYWDQFSGSIYYEQMGSSQRQLYDKLKSLSQRYLTGNATASVMTLDDGSSGYYTDSVTYSDMSSAQAFYVATIFFYENPQYYFLNDGIGYTEPLSSLFWGISEPGTISLGIYSRYASASARKTYTEKYKDAIDKVISKASSYKSDLAKETYFHDSLAKNVSYNGDTDDNNEDDTQSQSAASVFLLKKTVCAGFTKAFSLLLNSQGIKNVGVTSDSHAWNEVMINDIWYITDVTWDQNKWPSHDFFNISESEIRKSDSQWAHLPLSCYYGIRPECVTDHDSSVDAIDLTSTDSSQADTDSGNDTNKENPTIIPVTPSPQEVTSPRPAKPYSFSVKKTGKGAFTLKIKTSEKVAGFYIYYRLKGDKVWDTRYIKVNGRQKTFKLSGLVSGRIYQIKAFSSDSKGTLSKGTKIRIIKA